MQIVVVESHPGDYARVAALISAAFAQARLQLVASLEAYRALLAGPAPHLLLLADTLPWADGLTLLAEARTRWPQLPVIMLAANGDVARAVAGMQAGLADYLLKAELARLPAAIQAARRPLQPDAELRRYRMLSELTSDYVFEVALCPDGEWRAVWISEAIERVTGYSTADFLTQGHVQHVIHPEDRAVFAQVFDELLAGRERTIDVRIVTRAGELRWLRMYRRPVWDAAEGRVVRYFGAAHDITKARRAEQAVRFLAEASVALADTLAEDETLQRAVRLAVPFLADVGVLELYNPASGARSIASAHSDPSCEALLADWLRRFPMSDAPAYPIDMVRRTGMSVLIPEVVPPSEQLVLSPEDQQLLARIGIPRSAMVIPLLARERQVGTFSFIICESLRQYNADDLALAEDLARRVALAADNARLFSERQRLAEQAQAQAAELTAIFQHAPLGLSLHEPHPPYRCLQHNQVKLRMFGEQWVQRGSMVGASIDDLVEPAAARVLTAIFDQTVQSGEPLHLDEFGTTPTGETKQHYYTWSATPLRGADGVMSAILVACVEITARKEAEEERIALERALQIAQKVEGLGTMAGGIAHDFNNLLAVIRGNLDLAIEDLPQESPVAATLQRAELATRRAAELTAKLLAYTGLGVIATQPVDLNDLVHELGSLLHSSVPRGIELRLSLAAGLPLLSADATQLRQVVMNLVINAAEAIGQGPGTITVSTAERRVERAELAQARVGAELLAGRYVLLQVRDSGPGMDAATLERIFDPFFSTKFTGRGLGLAAALGIVRGHNGALAVVSAPGSGATFMLFLPSAAAPAAPAPTAEHAAGTILVVDDEPDLRDLVATVARRLNLRTLSAGDGDEALLVFEQHAATISCVVLDLTMPRRDGASTFEALRALRPALPIVLMSGYSAHEISRRLAGAQPTAFLQKPFSTSDLIATLRQIVQP